MVKNLECGECGGKMIIGFIPELSHGGGVSMSYWVEGEPKKSFWTGLKLDFWKRNVYFIVSYRCERCGFLKQYAESKLPVFKND